MMRVGAYLQVPWDVIDGLGRLKCREDFTME
jgi:hypothetical protein